MTFRTIPIQSFDEIPPTSAADAGKWHCEVRWKDDKKMVEFCEKKQLQAMTLLIAPQTFSEPTRGKGSIPEKITQHCVSTWRTEWKRKVLIDWVRAKACLDREWTQFSNIPEKQP